MNKKIISLAALLLILGSLVVGYIFLNQQATEQKQYYSDDSVNEEDILQELDDIFLSEDDEIEIGEMI